MGNMDGACMGRDILLSVSVCVCACVQYDWDRYGVCLGCYLRYDGLNGILELRVLKLGILGSK